MEKYKKINVSQSIGDLSSLESKLVIQLNAVKYWQ